MTGTDIFNTYKYFLIFIFLFILYIFGKIHILDTEQKNNEFKPNITNYTNQKEIILSKGRKFIDKCLNSTDNIIYEINQNPIITTIIPSFNCEKTISSSLHSAEYQNISNIEIIIVDDYSKDNSKEIINKFMAYDKRIKLIKNKKNMGTLYSRSIGSLMAKGNYIMCLDNDDLFFDEDVFDFIYKQAQKDNLDLVSFRVIVSKNYYDEISKMQDYRFFGFENNLYLSQPSLGIFPISLNGIFSIHDNEIWSKCIKSEIYKKAVNLLGIERYSKYVSWAEDTSINFIIFNIAESFKYTHKIGYFHVRIGSAATFNQNINIKLFGELFFLDVMFDFSKNTSDKNFVVDYALNIRKKFKIKEYSECSKDNNYKYLKMILSKIVKCPYITPSNIEKIKHYFKNFFNYT